MAMNLDGRYTKNANVIFFLNAAVQQNVSCKVETMNGADLNPVTDLAFVDADGVFIYGPMAIWRWVAQRMNSDKPVS